MRTSQPNKNRKIISTPNANDWNKGRTMWTYLKGQYGQFSWDKSLPEHASMRAEYEKSPKSLVGEPVLIIADEGGYPYHGHPYPAMILKMFEVGGIGLFAKCIFHPIDQERWDGERIEDVALFRLLPLREIDPLTTEQMQEQQMTLILTSVNNARNSNYKTMQSSQKSYTASIESYRRSIAEAEANLEKITEQIQAYKGDFITIPQLKHMVNELARHQKVDFAFLDATGHLVVQTQMLYTLSPKAHKENKRKPIGRFALYIDPLNSRMLGWNMDYYVNSYGHPNLNSNKEFCYGENGGDIHAMIRNGEFYNLIDFITLFLSLWPHDSGSPYIAHATWMATRTHQETPNPWGNGTRVYEVHQTEETKNKVTRTKKRKSVIRDAMTNIAQAITK